LCYNDVIFDFIVLGWSSLRASICNKFVCCICRRACETITLYSHWVLICNFVMDAVAGYALLMH